MANYLVTGDGRYLNTGKGMEETDPAKIESGDTVTKNGAVLQIRRGTEPGELVEVKLTLPPLRQLACARPRCRREGSRHIR